MIDTALVYDHTRGRPFKPALRWLAEHFLQKQIQTSESGHDSIEDARTAMALVQLKLQSGQGFGEHRHASESLFTYLHRHKRRAAMVDTSAVVNAHARPPASAYPATSDYEVRCVRRPPARPRPVPPPLTPGGLEGCRWW